MTWARLPAGPLKRPIWEGTIRVFEEESPPRRSFVR